MAEPGKPASSAQEARVVDRLALTLEMLPVIFFQGAEDKVVPPNQTELMVAALKNLRRRTAWLPQGGEQQARPRRRTVFLRRAGPAFGAALLIVASPLADRIVA